MSACAVEQIVFPFQLSFLACVLEDNGEGFVQPAVIVFYPDRSFGVNERAFDCRVTPILYLAILLDMIGHCLEAEDYCKFRIILLEILAALEKKDGAAECPIPTEEKERRSAMIAYVTIGTGDMGRATNFYNALLAELDPNIKVIMDAGRIKLWGKPGAPSLAVATPFDGKSATVGNGVMVAFAADSPAKVDAIYKKALELGGTDEGAPGRRGGDSGPYIGYFRDLDGNKLNAICMG